MWHSGWRARSSRTFCAMRRPCTAVEASSSWTLSRLWKWWVWSHVHRSSRPKMFNWECGLSNAFIMFSRQTAFLIMGSRSCIDHVFAHRSFKWVGAKKRCVYNTLDHARRSGLAWPKVLYIHRVAARPHLNYLCAKTMINSLFSILDPMHGDYMCMSTWWALH